MKKKYLLIILLVLSLLFNIYSIAIQNQKKRNANDIFITCIDTADSCFGVDYDKIDEGTKTYYFSKLSSNLHTASDILQFTSYANVPGKVKGSMNAISKLYLITTNPNKTTTEKLKTIGQKEQAAFKYLHFISNDPQNKDNWDKLLKVENDINF
ncbi:hypothetical protein [Clostridium sp. DMHC 10]|uniref:hypothetical protein n=2 Tax=Clostridium TaxID=1485 RepID=UPI00069D9EBE|nr:hypothetical protein [Clostridium sp. DMHC 10]